MKKWLSVLVIVVLAVSMFGCNEKANDSNSNTNNDKVNEKNVDENIDETNVEIETIPSKAIVEVQENRPVVSIIFEDYETITLELYPELAPNTVNNFIDLIQKGFYDGLKFHRVINGFMIQGGDPDGNGTGGPGYSIDAEFTAVNGEFISYLSHSRGVLSMARSQDINSAGSQFFIVHQDSAGLDQQYTAFGKVIDNMEVVDEISNVATGDYDDPNEDVIITKIIVELNGYDFTEPKVNK